MYSTSTVVASHGKAEDLQMFTHPGYINGDMASSSPVLHDDHFCVEYTVYINGTLSVDDLARLPKPKHMSCASAVCASSPQRPRKSLALSTEQESEKYINDYTA